MRQRHPNIQQINPKTALGQLIISKGRSLFDRHYVPATFAYDESYEDRAYRAGTLDGFHGYPEQSPEGKSDAEREAYKKGFAKGKSSRDH